MKIQIAPTAIHGAPAIVCCALGENPCYDYGITFWPRPLNRIHEFCEL